MDTKLKCSDFAKALGINRALITIARDKGHLVMDSEGLYDYNNPKNAFWIKGQTLKGKVWDIGRISAMKFNTPAPEKKRTVKIQYESVAVKKDTSIVQQPKGGNTIDDDIDQEEDNQKRMAKFSADLQEQKIKAEIIKLKNHNILEELKIGKVEGSLLPVSAVETLFIWAVRDFQKTYEQETDSLANIYIKNLGGNQNDFISVKKELMAKLSFIGETYKENLLSGLENAVAEYSEVRSRGERK